MKFSIFPLFLIALLSACAAPDSPPTPQPKPEQIIVGGDSDAHGCKASAGYTYSIALNRCIRIWEDGKNLLNFGDNSKSQYFLVSNSANQYELFAPNVQNLIFNKDGKHWVSSDNKYCLGITVTEGDKKANLLVLSTKNESIGCEYESLAYIEISSQIKTKP